MSLFNLWHHLLLIINYNNRFSLLMASLAYLVCFMVIYVHCSVPNCMKSTTPQGALGLSSFDMIANFQSGSAKLFNNQDGSRYHSFNITLAQQFNCSYYATISFQNIFQFQIGNGLDFFITTNMHSQLGFLQAILVMDIQAKWTCLSICFAASSRSDFGVGVFVSNNAQLLLSSPPTGTILKVHHQLPNALNLTNQFVYAVPFIGGMRTYDLYMNFSFINAKFDVKTRILSVDMFISYQKYPLQDLYVSYLIFNILSDLQISSLIDPNTPPININIFLGVTAVNPLQNAIINQQRPIVGLGASPAQQQAFDLMFGIHGIVIQTQKSVDILYLPLSKNVTSALTAQTFYCISKTKCYNMGGVMIYQQLGIFYISQECHICMKYAQYNQTLQACTCVFGFTISNGICVNSSQICNSNETYSISLQRCTCNNLYVNLSGRCIYLLDICPAGKIYFENNCITIVYNPAIAAACRDGYIFINNICVQMNNCTAPMQLDLSTNICRCPKNTQLSNNDTCIECSMNQTWTNYSCKCKMGYFGKQKQCLRCSVNGRFNGSQCVCLEGYSGDGVICIQDRISGQPFQNQNVIQSNPTDSYNNDPNP